jgi:RNA polymerase sigma factor (sigma-70 family)
VSTSDPAPKNKPADAVAHSAEPSGEARGGSVERLFREHNESLIRFLRARLHSTQEAEEVAHEAYVQILGLGDTGTVSYLQAYLFKTAANIATDRLRQRTTRRRIDALVFLESAIEARSPENASAAEQELALVNRALEELPELCRQAFLLVQFENVSFDEAAARLGLHPRRVRRFVARAIEHCHRVLSESDSHHGGAGR